MRGSFDQSANPLKRRRLSAGKSKLPASLTPQQQSLNRTQQFISSLNKKPSVAQVATTTTAVIDAHEERNDVEAAHHEGQSCEEHKEEVQEAKQNHEDLQNHGKCGGDDDGVENHGEEV